MGTKVKLGLIGLGNQGKEYLQAITLSKQAEIVAAYDQSPDTQKTVQSQYPNLCVTESLQQLQAQHLDGLILALPHDCYEPIWSQLLNFKLPMLKEKPLGRDISEAQHFIEQARQQACPIQTAIQRRQHPTYIRLAEEIKGQAIIEIDAHMHLGFSPESNTGWRANRQKAGGGALLDSGYHLVDLVLFLIGQFELVNACLWHEDQLMKAASELIETEAVLLGRQNSTWVKIDSRLSGQPCANSKTGYQKSEGVHILTTTDHYYADRSILKKNDVVLLESQRDWTIAISRQLDQFADNITQNRWNQRIIWEQLPAMQLIDRAYSLVFTA